MKPLKFKKIDAFTKGISPGNPAGYVYLEDEEQLTEDQMQKIAAELKGYVNEVGFVSRVGDEFNLKFYSSECEVAFCGHATIAIMYDLISTNSDLISKPEVFINVTAGKLSVFNHINEEDAVYIMAPEPEFLEYSPHISKIADILHADVSDIDDTSSVKLIDGGLRTLIVPMKTLSGCLNLSPDEESLRLFCLDNEIDIVHVSTKETYSANCEYRTRVFAPKYGYLEDPATGSGNAAFGYYLIEQGQWPGMMTVEQGSDKSNPNFVKIKRYSVNGKVHMIFGGCGTIRIEGRYYLHK